MDPKSCYRVQLIKYATDSSQEKVVFAWPRKDQVVEHVKWEADGNGQVSLFLTKLQNSDGGLYGCELCHGWECTVVKNISLKVRECKLSSVKAALRASVELKCPVGPVSERQGPQNILWTKLKGDDPVPVNYTGATVNDTSLTLHSVTASDSGWYRCEYMLGKTQLCFDIKLTVAEEATVRSTDVAGTRAQQALSTTETSLANRKEESSGTVIAVMTSLIIIAIIGALMGLLIYRRRHTQGDMMPTQRHSAGTLRQSVDGYETVNLTLPDDRLQQSNSLYQQLDIATDQSMCTTFQR
ncbi:uncharacterized protein LOC113122730 isoform X2 [Mastacembelus armatus]|nr:uncharacterized protein LOC113122730 isoform X2 [Mastacembelus armatus]